MRGRTRPNPLMLLLLSLAAAAASLEEHAAPAYWKCRGSSTGLGAKDGAYFQLRNSTCRDLGVDLHKCCEKYETCANDQKSCVKEHHACNKLALGARLDECQPIADQLVVYAMPEELACKMDPDSLYNATSHCVKARVPITRCCAELEPCNASPCPLRTCLQKALNSSHISSCDGIVEQIAGKEEQDEINDAVTPTVEMVTALGEHSAPADWKCLRSSTFIGAKYAAYFHLRNSSCSDLRDDLNECCKAYETCEKDDRDCINDHHACNKIALGARLDECQPFAEKLVAFPEPLKCNMDHESLYNATSHCVKARGRITRCCEEFDPCTTSPCPLRKCLQKALVSSHLRSCSGIINLIAGKEEQDGVVTRPVEIVTASGKHAAPANWKCRGSSTGFGAKDGAYFQLRDSTCSDMMYYLHECCIKYETCPGDQKSCVKEHHTCNKLALGARLDECQPIADKLVVYAMPEELSCNMDPDYLYEATSHCVKARVPITRCCAELGPCNTSPCPLRKCLQRALKSSHIRSCDDIVEQIAGKEERDGAVTRTVEIYIRRFYIYGRREMKEHPIRSMLFCIIAMVGLICGCCCCCCLCLSMMRAAEVSSDECCTNGECMCAAETVTVIAQSTRSSAPSRDSAPSRK